MSLYTHFFNEDQRVNTYNFGARKTTLIDVFAIFIALFVSSNTLALKKSSEDCLSLIQIKNEKLTIILDKIDKVRLENYMPTSVEEIIGQKAVHEAVHVLDKGSQSEYQPDKNNREELPIKKEIEAVKQTPLYRIKQQ